MVIADTFLLQVFNGGDVVIRADRALFASLLVIREKRSVSKKELLQYSLSPIAWSLVTPEGNILKSVKSKLQNALEEKMSLVNSVPQNCARFLMECVLSNNYQVAWRYLVASRILY